MNEQTLDDYLPVDRDDLLDGFECFECGESYDELMDRPTVKVRGYNPRSGILLRCYGCDTNITEAEIRLRTRNPWNKGDLMDKFEPNDDHFIPYRELKSEIEETKKEQ